MESLVWTRLQFEGRAETLACYQEKMTHDKEGDDEPRYLDSDLSQNLSNATRGSSTFSSTHLSQQTEKVYMI